MPDTSRQVATNPDEYTLTIEEAASRYEHAGHPRTIRSIQRYCLRGHLDCLRQETTFGDRYLITPQSVARHIAQIEELTSLDKVATDRDQSRQVATSTPGQEIGDAHAAYEPTSDDKQRQSTTATPGLSPYAARLEREVEQAKDERDFLREQIDRKDKTIEALIERDRETNFLVRGLQEMLTPLLGSRRETPPPTQPTA